MLDITKARRGRKGDKGVDDEGLFMTLLSENSATSIDNIDCGSNK